MFSLKGTLVFLALIYHSAFVAATRLAQRDGAEVAATVPNSYIVELNEGVDIKAFYQDLEANGIDFIPRTYLNYTLFNGCSFQLQKSGDSRVVGGMAAVKKLWPVKVAQGFKPEVQEQGMSAVLPRDHYIRQDHNDTFAPHLMIQVDKLHAEGITGAGVKVAILDTGVDYRHPALGGCFGPGCLVSFGKDLIGDNFDSTNIPVPDDDPFDSCNGHGTHVSGIIAAQTNPLGFTGAAPGVTLGMYRMAGCTGSVFSDLVISAFNLAYEDGADIITLSSVLQFDWGEDPTAVAVQRIVEAGVICTAALGNNGRNGLFTAGSPSVGHGVASVAATDNTQTAQLLLKAAYSVDNSSNPEPFAWARGVPEFGNLSLPVWLVKTNSGDACDALPADTPDLSSFIVLTSASKSCNIVQQVESIADRGGRYVMVYSTTEVATAGDLSSVSRLKGFGAVPASTGQIWVNLLKDNHQVTLHMVNSTFSDYIAFNPPNTATGGYIRLDSSWGLTWELDLKPQFSAPGGYILSTWPVALGSYKVLSGTSMATPLVASAYALLVQKLGTRDPTTLTNLLSATANPNFFNDGSTVSTVLAPVAQQGAGLIQVYDAAHSTTVLSVSSLLFNDTANLAPATFTITNQGKDPVTYSLSHVKATTMYVSTPGDFTLAAFPNPIADSWATLGLSSTSITIAAGGSAAVTVTSTPPSGLEDSRLPVYGGYVAINGTNGESLSIPYVGVAGSMHAAPVMATTPDLLFLEDWSDVFLDPVPANTSFTIPVPTELPPDGMLPTRDIPYPAGVFSRVVGTAVLLSDLVAVNVSGPINTTMVLGLEVVAGGLPTFGMPVTYLPGRGDTELPFTGMMSDRSVVPEGQYALVQRGLKIYGDRNKPEDYDWATVGPFFLKYSH